ncbi:MAG: TonB-dependent receptor [Acidobacteriota bacterium]|nr:TonB-dependent receptor [Acidobacteriota bacterium]
MSIIATFLEAGSARRNYFVRSLAPILSTLILITAVYLACVTPVAAQIGGQGSVTGTITDPSGAVIPGASVTATNNATNDKTTRTTSNSGTFILSPLVPGNYTVTVSASGFKALTEQSVTVDALQVTSLKPILTVGSTSETVTVEAAPPQLDTANATVGATMENEEYTSLPLQINGGARNPTAFVYLMPGVAHGGSGVQTGIFDGTGSSGRLDEVYIDGFPQTSIYEQGDPRYVSNTISVEAVDQFQVVTNNPSAQYQGVGLENYVIKSGTNTWHGSVFDYYRNTSLDTWGFYSKAAINPTVGHAVKPQEHQSEYGVALNGPILHDRLFFMGTYDGFYYHKDNNPLFTTIPTSLMRQGNFSELLPAGSTVATCTYNAATNPNPPAGCIYDPTSCPVGATASGTCVRMPFSFNGIVNNINPSMIGKTEQFMQSFLPIPINSSTTNNYLSEIPSFTHHWDTTDRIDASLTARQRLSFIFGAELGGVYGYQSNGSNPGPLPYTSGQGFETKNKIFLIDHTVTINPNLINQFKYGFTRFWGPVFNPDYQNPGYGLATNGGVTGLPPGQASLSFPTVTWAGGTVANTQWSGDQDFNDLTNYFTLMDNVQWVHGKHSFTFGVGHQWLQVQDLNPNTISSPVTLAYSNAQTALYIPKSGGSTQSSATGNSYAGFLLGQVNQGSLTQQTFTTTGARMQPTSAYAQDDVALTPNITVNLGIRWDYYPPYREVLNRSSFLNPTLTNPITGNLGALQFAGNGSGPTYCNCVDPINHWYKNFSPRIGIAYALRPTTVIRAGYSLNYTHGTGQRNATYKGTGTVGFSAAPAITSLTSGDQAFNLNSGFPAYPTPPTINAGYGTAFSTAVSTPAVGMNYPDPYLGNRAPYADMFNVGIEQQFTKNLALKIAYVGTQGHFLPAGSGGARGIWNNEIDPKYLALGSLLGATVTPSVLTQSAALGFRLSLPYPTFNGTLTQMLKPFPQYNSVADTYDNIDNSNYNALQVTLKQRVSHGLQFMVNFTWGAEIDDNGTFRSGYLSTRVERSRGLSDVPHVVNSTAVWDLPFGANRDFNPGNRIVRALVSGYQISGIYTASSGIPLAVVASNCVAPGQSQCMPNFNPSYIGTARINGKYGNGALATGSPAYVDINAFIDPGNTARYPNYTIGNLARTRPYGLRGPSSYDIDLSLKRTIAVHEKYKILLDVSAYNLTNVTIFTSPAVNTSSSGNFGKVTGQANQPRDIQLSGRFNF